jgi:hypothetical protein
MYVAGLVVEGVIGEVKAAACCQYPKGVPVHIAVIVY